MKILNAVLILSIGMIPLLANGQGEKGATAGNVQVTPRGSFPIVNEPVTIDVMVQDAEGVTDWATNEYTKWLEDKTNIHAAFTPVPSDGIKERLNLAIASGDLPDAFMAMPFEASAIQLYGTQGIFLPLNDYIDEYGEGMQRVFAEVPYARGTITSLDGNIYGIPRINECYHCSFNIKAWLYKPWLDEVGMEWPQTTEELYQVLKAFRDGDPNGNGLIDEIPFSGANISWADCDVEQFLMNSFLYNDSKTRLFVDKGNIVFGPTTAEWKEGLKYIHRLYAGGLIAPETFTQDSTQYGQMGKAEPHILGVGLTAYPGLFADFAAGKPGQNFYALQPVRGPSGVQFAGWSPFSGCSPAQLVITSGNEYPAATYRWGDFMLTNESTLRATDQGGIEEMHWRKAEAGEMTLDGVQATWTTIKYPEGEKAEISTNVGWDQRGPSMRTSAWRAAWSADISVPRGGYSGVLYTGSKVAYQPYIPGLSQIVPPLVFNEDQATEMVDLKTPITNYVKTMIAKFVVGEEDIEDGWSAYVSELEKMGVERYVEIYQTAYDIQKKFYLQ